MNHAGRVSFLSFVQKVLQGENITLFEERPAILDSDILFEFPVDSSTNSVEHVLKELSSSTHSDVRGFVAKYRSTPTSISYDYLNDPDPEVRRTTVKKFLSAMTEREFQEFSNSHYEDVQQEVVRHPDAPNDILAELAGTSQFEKLRTKALNRLFASSLQFSAQEILATSKQRDVLMRIMAYHDVALSILISIVCTCEVDELRQVALEKLPHQRLLPDHLKQLVGSPYQDVQSFCCDIPEIPEELMLELLESTSYQPVRQRALARILKTQPPEGVLERLAGSQHKDVVLTTLQQYPVSIEVTQQLAINSVYPEIRATTLSATLKQDAGSEVMKRLAQSIHLDVLSKIAVHPFMPADCYPVLASRLGDAIQKEWVRLEERTTQEWVEDDSYEYDAYGYSYSTGGHYEDVTDFVTVIEYDNINKLLPELPLQLKQMLKERLGILQHDKKVNWADKNPA